MLVLLIPGVAMADSATMLMSAFGDQCFSVGEQSAQANRQGQDLRAVIETIVVATIRLRITAGHNTASCSAASYQLSPKETAPLESRITTEKQKSATSGKNKTTRVAFKINFAAKGGAGRARSIIIG